MATILSDGRAYAFLLALLFGRSLCPKHPSAIVAACAPVAYDPDSRAELLKALIDNSTAPHLDPVIERGRSMCRLRDGSVDGGG